MDSISQDRFQNLTYDAANSDDRKNIIHHHKIAKRSRLGVKTNETTP